MSVKKGFDIFRWEREFGDTHTNNNNSRLWTLYVNVDDAL